MIFTTKNYQEPSLEKRSTDVKKLDRITIVFKQQEKDTLLESIKQKQQKDNFEQGILINLSKNY